MTLYTEIRAVDGRLAQIVERMNDALAQHGTRLPQVPGIGPVIAARIVGRVGDPTCFAGTAAFANYTGVAPIEVSSGTKSRHRLSRGGDRQLNSALHLVAVTQIRMTGSVGRVYYDAKRLAGKTHREAVRCLKRRLADHIWRLMIADHRRLTETTGPGGHSGATLRSSAADPTPTANSSDKSLPGPAIDELTTSTRSEA